MKKIKLDSWILFFVIATIPFFSGTRQPLVSVLYLFVTFLAAGTWAVLNSKNLSTRDFTVKPFLILGILAFLVLTTLDLPLAVIEVVSPVRAENLLPAMQPEQFIKTTSLSYYVPGTQFYAVYGLTLFLLFYFSAALLKNAQNRAILLWIFVIAGGLEAVYGILQAVFPAAPLPGFPGSSSTEGYPAGTFSNHNHYAAFLNICWPVAMVLGISRIKNLFEKVEVIKIKNKKLFLSDRLGLIFHRALLPFWATGIMLAAIILSRSFTGIVIMFILVLLCRIVIPFQRPIKIILSGAIYSALLVYGWILGVEGIISRSTLLIHAAQARFSTWTAGLEMLQDHLYSGIGMGAFQFMAPFYISQPGTLMDQPLAGSLELAVQLGLPVTLFFLAWLLAGMAVYARSIYRMPRKIQKMSRDEIIIIGSCFALAGLIINIAAAGLIHTPAMAFYAVLLLALLHRIMLSIKDTGYTPDYLFLQKKPVNFVPYRKPGRRFRR
ncbi:MAG: hypothetical protein SCH71_17075 [Desulfobulbaceae bacterium]|nr:hypothetical protein [Desulfobulbaceae bacterium]